MRQMTVVFICVFAFGLGTFAQTKLAPVDKSPLDICYYPNNFPVLKIQNKVTEPCAARIIYSRPQKTADRFMENL